MIKSGTSGTVTTVGEILVEMMSTTSGHGFLEPQTILGPYPSGAPAIFIDQVATLGIPCSIVGSVGDDDFGKVNINRLKKDGVDTSTINISADRATGIAFVRYRPDGQRDFVFTLSCSAASQISKANLEQQLQSVDHLHVVGSSLSMASVASYVKDALSIVKSREGTVSFDPNVRPEIMQDPELATLLLHVLWNSDLVLPSEGELTHLCNTQTDEQAITELLNKGVPEIVLKRSDKGASRYTSDGEQHHPGFPVKEVDPTGAGDCFGATYVACKRLDHSAESALEHACAAGAMAVLEQGPMEGTASLSQIRNFIQTQLRR